MPAQTVIRLRIGTAAQWTTTNSVLALGEVGVESDTNKFKFGDGTTAWTSLSYAVASSSGSSTIDWTDVLNKPSTFPPSTHTHPISDVTSLQTALDGKAAVVHTHVISDTTGLQTALDGKAATVHTHAISNVTGLQTALDGKAATVHTHAISDVTGLQTALDGKIDEVNGAVTTASTSSTVVRNITLSTSAPSGGADGDVWLVYTA